MHTEQGARQNGPRRTALAQSRSKQTRRRLVRAAVQLWTERGFETGIEETTVEEIAKAAGVTKGTFYFHFAHKEEILLELGWGTAEALYDEAVRGVASRRSGIALVHQLLVSLARRVESVPPAAVLGAVASFYATRAPRPVPGRRDMHHGLDMALQAARAQGELPPSTDTEELARILAALAMDGLLRWAQGDSRRLRTVLHRRADVVLAGARSIAAASRDPGDPGDPAAVPERSRPSPDGRSQSAPTPARAPHNSG
jgi:AcrR family transcriptional regulator